MKAPHQFKFWHSLVGTIVLVVIQYFAVAYLVPMESTAVVLALATVGSITALYAATEIIEEVRGAFHMILLLTSVVLQFVIFFAFEYLFLMHIQPSSFPTLQSDPMSLLLHSVMVFVFNPLYLPGTSAARGLVLIETFAALGLAVFILQNISELRKKALDRSAV